MNKYKNIKIEHNGLKFDSKREFHRYLFLLEEEKKGNILHLETQTRFPIHVNGDNICSYVSDFTFIDRVSGKMVVQDVKPKGKDGKGHAYFKKTPAWAMYRLKKKLMKAVYGIDIQEV